MLPTNDVKTIRPMGPARWIAELCRDGFPLIGVWKMERKLSQNMLFIWLALPLGSFVLAKPPGTRPPVDTVRKRSSYFVPKWPDLRNHRQSKVVAIAAVVSGSPPSTTGNLRRSSRIFYPSNPRRLGEEGTFTHRP